MVKKKSLVGFIPGYASILDNFQWIKDEYDFKELKLPIIREEDVWGSGIKVRITIERYK